MIAREYLKWCREVAGMSPVPRTPPSGQPWNDLCTGSSHNVWCTLLAVSHRDAYLPTQYLAR